MRIVTLTTDFGHRDGYAGCMKGVIKSISPDAEIIDISHDIPSFDILSASFVLYSHYKYFPKDTIHVVVVDPGVGSIRKAICVKTWDYVFIAPDNGVLSFPLEKERIERIVEITDKKYFLHDTSNTFHGRDIFAPTAGYISKGVPIVKLGKEIRTIEVLEETEPVVTARSVKGKIIHVDKFGNLVTNIDKNAFFGFTGRGKYEIRIKNKVINKVSNSYSEGKKNTLLAIFGSSGFLEISANMTNASKLLKCKQGDDVIVKKQ